jgi:acyl dehydratase
MTNMPEQSLITEQMKSFIGVDIDWGPPFDVEKGAIKAFAEAINDPNPLFTDEKYAKSKGHSSVVAPLIFPTYNLPLGAPLKVLKFTFTIATGVHGGDEWELLQDVHAGDTLTPKGKIISLVEREGKKGKMLFVTSEVTFKNQRGEVAAIYRPTEIFIAAPAK